MNKDDLITIVKHGGLDDATTRVVVSEIERGDLSQSSLMIVESIVRKGHFTSPQNIRERADKLRGVAPTEKARFGSRSEAGRYAANMRWQRAGVTGEMGDPVGVLNNLLSQGYTVSKVDGTDLAGMGRLKKEVRASFEEAIHMDRKNGDRRRAGYNLVKMGLLGSGDQESHLVLKDASGRVAGVATVTFGFKGDTRTAVPENGAYIQTIGTTGLVRGAGTALIGQVISDARSQGKKVVQLESYDSAVPFYEKLGFKKFRLGNLGEKTNEMELKI